MPGGEENLAVQGWWRLISRDRSDNEIGLDMAGRNPEAQRGLAKKNPKNWSRDKEY